MGGKNDPALAAKRAEAVRLRAAGEGYAAIAHALGYGGPGAAHKAVAAALRATQAEPAEDLRRLECARLDVLVVATSLVRSG